MQQNIIVLPFIAFFTMNNTSSSEVHRFLCQQRDKEFLALYHPTLDALLEQGLPIAKARQAAVEFTIANGHPRYHVNHENAYRRVCHMLKASEKHGNGARTFDHERKTGLAETRQRRHMWEEITQQVRELIAHGLSVDRAVEHVLEHGRASRFFITPSTALTKICTHARSRALR